MKRIKKVMALLIAMVMVLSMAATVSAEAANVKLSVNPVEGHTYTAYQLFVGDLAGDGKTLSNVKWGSNVAGSISYKVDGETKTINPQVNQDVPKEVLDYLATLATKTSTDAAQATANIISDWVTGEGTVLSQDGVDVKTGYYVVKDAYTDSAAGQTTTLSTVVCEVVGPTTITPKAGTTSHEKEVLDVNDTADVALDLSNLKDVDASKWDKSADHDFGDNVPFKLTTTIGSDFAKYNNYYLAVNDTLKDGLKLDQDSIKVYVDGVLATEGDEAGQYSLTKADQSFKVEFSQLNGNDKAAAGKEVVVYYTATLDATAAVIGNPGNWNESYAEFSNNPNGNQEGKGETPHSTAVVFTYKTEVNKVEPDGENGTKPLAGAEFTLTKKLKDGTTATIAVIKYDKDGKVTTTTADGTATSSGDATKFVFEGLDDGVYTLTETVTPNGYNSIEPVTFKITAAHNETDGISELKVKNEDDTDFNGELTFTVTPATGSVKTDVLNQKGSTLPSTGGIGTTIFYVIGTILVLGAAVLLVTKRRMSAQK